MDHKSTRFENQLHEGNRVRSGEIDKGLKDILKSKVFAQNDEYAFSQILTTNLMESELFDVNAEMYSRRKRAKERAQSKPKNSKQIVKKEETMDISEMLLNQSVTCKTTMIVNRSLSLSTSRHRKKSMS